MNTIEIRDLSFSYPGSSVPILNNINVTIEKGDFLAIIGNNGCGKSTFCKTLNGIIPQFISGEFSGSIYVNGVQTNQADIGSLAKKVGYVYQDFENQIIRPTVLDDASYSCLNYAYDDYKERGREALSKCGLKDRENDYIWQLSGGQTHLLALAGALSLEPDILILDEPIAQLDPNHADKIYEVLRDLNENHGKTIIVIEHHTEYIADYCKHVMLMKNGSVAWKLPTLEALVRVDELKECNIFPPQITMAAYQLRKMSPDKGENNFPTTIEEGKKYFIPRSTKPMTSGNAKEHQDKLKKDTVLSFQDVIVQYKSVKGEPRVIYNHLNLDIRKGDKIALIGSNGAGKSTMMKMMVGLVKPNNGEILLREQNIAKCRPEEISRDISMVYQNPEDMFIKATIEEDIAYAMSVRNIPDYEEKTNQLLERFHLSALKERDGRLLSGGQMRRASLAIGIALEPQVLLLDEPTANLDIATRKEIMKILSEMKDITDTVMIATHDMQLVCDWAERIIVLCGGEVVADGTRDEIFGNRILMERVGIRPPEIFSMARAIKEDSLCYTIDEFIQEFEGA